MLNAAIWLWPKPGGVQLNGMVFDGVSGPALKGEGLRTTELAAWTVTSPTPPALVLTRVNPPALVLTRVNPPALVLTRVNPPALVLTRVNPPAQKSLPLAPICRKSTLAQSSKPWKGAPRLAGLGMPSKLMSWPGVHVNLVARSSTRNRCSLESLR